jgi:hypothetical protein
MDNQSERIPTQCRGSTPVRLKGGDAIVHCGGSRCSMPDGAGFGLTMPFIAAIGFGWYAAHSRLNRLRNCNPEWHNNPMLLRLGKNRMTRAVWPSQIENAAI